MSKPHHPTPAPIARRASPRPARRPSPKPSVTARHSPAAALIASGHPAYAAATDNGHAPK